LFFVDVILFATAARCPTNLDPVMAKHSTMRRRLGDTAEDAWLVARDTVEERRPGYEKYVNDIIQQAKAAFPDARVPRELLPYDQERNPRILVTYSRITPESAEEGDFSENGWIDDEGESMLPADDDETVVDRAVEFLLGAFIREASSGSFSPGTWYMTGFDVIDYSTGEEEEKAYHLKDFTDDEEKTIYTALKAKNRSL
jgi:hypothetical protein